MTQNDRQGEWVENFDAFWKLQFPNSHPAEYGVVKKFISKTVSSQKKELLEKLIEELKNHRKDWELYDIEKFLEAELKS